MRPSSFFDWADRMFDWVSTIGLVNGTASPGSLYVYDGSDDLLNCTEFDHVQWTYNAGIFMHGCAVMWNQTTGATQARWEARVQQFMTGLNIFFKDTVMFEVACEPQANCNNDQKSFKAYLSRWMAQTIKVAPWTRPTLYPLLQSSAQAAAKACSGGNAGTTCGMKWTTGTYDGDYGPGQQMSALEVIQANLLDAVAGPVSNLTGGTSTGNNLAGTGGESLFRFSSFLFECRE
jgi:mannan endo-1,6-alpha-mannosidase